MPRIIESLQNERIKRAVKLRDRRGRERQERIVIDGLREIRRAINSHLEITELFVCDSESQAAEVNQIVASALERGVDCTNVTSRVFDKLSYGNRAGGLVAVARTPQAKLAEWQCPETPLIAVLEGVEKPGNLGAVIRSADGANVSAVFVADGRTDVYNPNSIRASVGTVFSLPVFAESAANIHQWLVEHNLKILTADANGSCEFSVVDLTKPTAIVLGSEAEGLSSMWQDNQTSSVRIPMLGFADSLNVSTTAAVLFYEALRQRTSASRG